MSPVALALVAQILAMAALGFALGLAYFGALRRTVALFGAGWLGLLALTLARFVVMALCLVAVARFGGAPSLLACFAGFLVARRLTLRAVRRTV